MDHGPAGQIYLTRSDDAGQTFAPPRLIVSHVQGRTNEHDALLSREPDGRLALITRSHGPRDFVTRIQFSTDGGERFGPAVRLAVPGGYGAFFGHLVPDAAGDVLLGTFYNGSGVLAVEVEPDRLTRPSSEPVALLVRGVIHQFKEGTRLNETSLARLASGRLVALSREQPVTQGLHVAWSDDDGRTFRPPRPIGVIGEAPSLLVLPDGGLLALYRDLDPDGLYRADYSDPDLSGPGGAAPAPRAQLRPCAVSLLHSPDGGQTWSLPRVLARYDGGRFHGGYGDLALLPQGKVLAACHLARNPGDLPVLACFRFRLP